MFGISPEAATMADCYAGLHPDDREVTAASYAAAADPARRALYDIEYRTVGKEDGFFGHRQLADAETPTMTDEGGSCSAVTLHWRCS
jgi:hypothetical protein